MKTNYPTMIAPFDFAACNKIAALQLFSNYSFFEISPKQAREYYKWFIGEIPHRILILMEYIKHEYPGNQFLDYSPESLIPLWEWYMPKIDQIPKTKEEIEQDVLKYPKWIEHEIRKETTKYSIEALSIALDISIYLGEIVVKNYPHLQWGCRTKPKNEFSANRPVIIGLSGKRKYFNPSRIVFVSMVQSSEGDSENSLYDIYRYWEQDYFIPSK